MDKFKNTADLLVECLETEGVEYIFGIPGEENLDVMNALEKSTIKFIPTRHEQGAAFMADVYGRLTGKAGVCLSTLGPGATNLVTGVADANMDGAPLVAITGQAGTDRMHLTSHQYVDLIKMFEPITQKSKEIVRPDTVSEIVRIAFKYAENEKPGATHINLPCNIAKMRVEDKPMKKVPVQKGYATASSIEKAAIAISEAKNPIILVGAEAARNNTNKAVTSIAEHLMLPTLNTIMAKGVISWKNRYSMWTFGIPQKDYQDILFNQADLIIAIGYDLVECAPRKWNPNRDKKIIHISSKPAHINKYYEPECEVLGDIDFSLNEIKRRASRDEFPKWAFKIKKEMETDYESFKNDSSYPMKPQKLLYDVRKVMDSNSILVSDVGAHKMWIGREYNCELPQSCIISNGFATMGIAIPGAIAAKLINPDKKVLAISGDGGFMMNMQELETAVRCKINFVAIILADNAYGLIKWKQDEQFGHHCFVDFTNPDFVTLADSMGCVGMKIESNEEFIPKLEKAFTMDKPVIIECPIDYSENMKLTKKLQEITEGRLK
ncbi:MAG: acetolactate synthase large subunit [Pleomorphochaeta sp.]